MSSKTKDELLFTVWSLVMVREPVNLPAQEVKQSLTQALIQNWYIMFSTNNTKISMQNMCMEYRRWII